MFLDLLDESQRFAYLRVARLLVSSDGILDGAEKRAFDATVNEAAVPAPREVARSLDDLTPDLARFQSQPSRRLLMLELVMIAASDGLIAEPERVLLHGIAERLELSRGLLGRLHQIAVQQREVRHQAHQLIMGE